MIFGACAFSLQFIQADAYRIFSVIPIYPLDFQNKAALHAYVSSSVFGSLSGSTSRTYKNRYLFLWDIGMTYYVLTMLQGVKTLQFFLFWICSAVLISNTKVFYSLFNIISKTLSFFPADKQKLYYIVSTFQDMVGWVGTTQHWSNIIII